MATVIRSIKFWINAFIPRDIPGYTMTVPKGRYAGHTATGSNCEMERLGRNERRAIQARGMVPRGTAS
jgi:hypothetical protein